MTSRHLLLPTIATGIALALAPLALAPAQAAAPARPNAYKVGRPAVKTAGSTWAPAAVASIHPGVQTVTNGGQCTANFVYTQTDPTGGLHVYIGQAAHCASQDNNTVTDGCVARVAPIGTSVKVGGASQPGTLVYDSWIAMQAYNRTHPTSPTSPEMCQDNDLALVELAPVDVAKVNPSIPHWGGPTGLNTTGTTPGDAVYSYGNSSLRLGITALSPKQGMSLGDTDNGWAHHVYTVTPGIPGDSGSAFLDSAGNALGDLSTVEALPVPGSNSVSDLSRELTYLVQQPGFTSAALAAGTEKFNAGAGPIG